MSNTETSCKQSNCCWLDIISNMQEYSKKPCVLKSHISQLGASSGPGKHKVSGQVLSRSWWCIELEMCNFHKGMSSCFYPMTCKKHQGGHAEIAHFHTHLFCMNCVLVMATPPWVDLLPLLQNIFGSSECQVRDLKGYTISTDNFLCLPQIFHYWWSVNLEWTQ